jgi:hypothetical protein
MRAGDGAHNRIHSVAQTTRRDEDALEAVLAMAFFMHALET